jgi:hypothetical protein
MREDVLKIIKSTKDVTNAVILTHNIDFVFVQSVVIPALRKCGSPALTIFADADCAAKTYQYQARVLSGLGLRYRVVPVAMKTGFHFHPKAVLLSGPKAATLLVGSGNLTFGGWRENGEVWFRRDTDTDGTSSFAEFHSYMREIVKLCVQPREAVATEVEEAFDPNTRTWAADMDPAGLLLGRAGHGGSMLEQMKGVFGAGGAEHLYVCAPYFDEDAEAVQALAQDFGAASTTILVQSKRTNLPAAAAASLGSQFSVKAARFERKEQLGSDGDERTREALLHAKFYAVQRGTAVTVFAGSANCSRAALTIAGSAGNAELMTHATIPWAEFERAFLDELVVENVQPELAAELIEEPLTDTGKGFIHIRAARMEAGHVRIAYQADTGTDVTNGLVDDHPLEPLDCGDGWVTFQTSQQPRIVELVGSNGGAEVRSLRHWIDDEYALRASARGRSLAESIHGRVRDGTWAIGAWTDVLSELYKHLQYMPKVGSRRRASDHGDDDKSEGPIAFEWDDVFADGYGLTIDSGFIASFPTGLEGRIGSLRSMILRWFGIGQPEADEDGSPEDEDVSDVGGTGSADDDGDSADRVTALSKIIPRSTLPPASERDRKRGLKIVKQVAKRLSEAEFLKERPPELLAADLKVTAVLFRVGLADAWISEQEFFDATLAIWLPLFFNVEGTESTGWLEQRYLTAPKQREFVEAIRSVELAAALGCWALSTPVKASSPEHARFNLASALGVARLPWLWQTGGNEHIAKEIAEVFVHTAPGDDLDWQVIERRWLTLIRRGYALGQMEQAAAGVDLHELRRRIAQKNVAAGELLWQGTAGFCVTTSDCARDSGETDTVEVLVLQQGKAKRFRVSFLVPVAGLLENGVLGDDVIPARAQRELAAMVSELRVGLAKR